MHIVCQKLDGAVKQKLPFILVRHRSDKWKEEEKSAIVALGNPTYKGERVHWGFGDCGEDSVFPFETRLHLWYAFDG